LFQEALPSAKHHEFKNSSQKNNWSWRSQAFRGLIYKIMAALAIGAAVWFLAHNTLLNMQVRGIKSGFDFLTQAAGFDIGESLYPFDSAQPYWQAFLVGVTKTLRVAKGERIVICGPSGSGKSTLIRCINRLEEHQQGRLIVNGIELANDVKAIDQVRKEVGMVFQHSTCFRI